MTNTFAYLHSELQSKPSACWTRSSAQLNKSNTNRQRSLGDVVDSNFFAYRTCRGAPMYLHTNVSTLYLDVSSCRPPTTHLPHSAWPVAALGLVSALVSPGAATDGVTPIFSRGKNWRTFLVIALWKVMNFFWKVMTLFSRRLLTTPVFPCRLSSVLYKFSHKKISFYSWMVSPGAVRPLVTPLCTTY